MLLLTLLNVVLCILPVFGQSMIKQDAPPVDPSLADKVAIDRMMNRLQKPMTGIVSKMARKMSSHYSFFGKHKRSLEKRSLSRKFEIYLSKTYGQPTLDSFRPKLKLGLKKALAQYQQKERLRKRDGIELTPEERKKDAEMYAKALVKDIQRNLVSHSTSKFERWKGQRRKNYKKQQTQKRDLAIIDKRSLLDPNKGSSELIAFAIGFVLSLPLFALFGGPSIAMGFALTAIMSLILQPVINKILLGYWFWKDDEPRQPGMGGQRATRNDSVPIQSS